jgi:hypothetical protein
MPEEPAAQTVIPDPASRRLVGDIFLRRDRPALRILAMVLSWVSVLSACARGMMAPARWWPVLVVAAVGGLGLAWMHRHSHRATALRILAYLAGLDARWAGLDCMPWSMPWHRATVLHWLVRNGYVVGDDPPGAMCSLTDRGMAALVSGHLPAAPRSRYERCVTWRRCARGTTITILLIATGIPKLHHENRELSSALCAALLVLALFAVIIYGQLLKEERAWFGKQNREAR